MESTNIQTGLKNGGRSPGSEKGFDLGDQMKVMGISDLDFNQALSKAGVYGCAYGHQQLPGFPVPVAFLALVGEDRREFEKAFQHFARWGCEQDGDVVDIHMMLKLDGTYEMWIGPEIERAMYRTVPQAELCRPMMFNVSYVKPFDSTHRFVDDLKRYCESAISPVVLTAAIGNRTELDINKLEDIADLPRLVKFDLKIIDQRKNANDPRFLARKGGASLNHAHANPSLSPSEYCVLRRRTLDVAFPVSRERVRRSGTLDRVRALPGFTQVTESQVIQAAVNLMLSSEITSGDRHYTQITKDLPKRIWDHISSRCEIADGKLKPADEEPMVVARQLELDIRYVLLQQGILMAGDKFAKLQALFRRKGYVDD